MAGCSATAECSAFVRASKRLPKTVAKTWTATTVVNSRMKAAVSIVVAAIVPKSTLAKAMDNNNCRKLKRKIGKYGSDVLAAEFETTVVVVAIVPVVR